jgi:hypothetical protein
MTPARLYRIAAILFVLFAAGHTFGFLTFKPPTPEAQAVHEAMSTVHFQVRNTTLSYGGFYVGFGLYVSVYLLFSAMLAWHLSRIAEQQPQAIGMLGWTFFTLQLASFALSWIYFSGPPAIFSALVAICLGWAARGSTLTAT